MNNSIGTCHEIFLGILSVYNYLQQNWTGQPKANLVDVCCGVAEHTRDDKILQYWSQMLWYTMNRMYGIISWTDQNQPHGESYVKTQKSDENWQQGSICNQMQLHSAMNRILPFPHFNVEHWKPILKNHVHFPLDRTACGVRLGLTQFHIQRSVSWRNRNRNWLEVLVS